jgi:hypothetical protein
MDDWTFAFIGNVQHDNKVANPTRDQAECLDAARYNEFWRDPHTLKLCVVRKVPMYYFQPLDVEALDCDPSRETANDNSSRPCFHGVLTSWRTSDLSRAYKDTAR